MGIVNLLWADDLMSYTRWKTPHVEAPKVYLKTPNFVVWYDSGKVMKRLSVDDAIKQRLIEVDYTPVSFGGDYYAATLIIKNSKIRITI